MGVAGGGGRDEEVQGELSGTKPVASRELFPRPAHGLKSAHRLSDGEYSPDPHTYFVEYFGCSNFSRVCVRHPAPRSSALFSE